ncbi:MAG: mandelate racemase/muconate lactonizing enzyme family protein [Opitutaceae bacterium]|nr:mandelate racemase/muconate lactonizing enzyme family protein [Opitutaceae bacterium]
MRIIQVICQILRIDKIEQKTAGTQDTIIIRIRTKSGLEGVGEADASPEVLMAIIDAPYSHNLACGLRELLVGRNAMEHEAIRDILYRRTMYFGRRAVGFAAIAGVDMALWDLKGKYLSEPIHRLLGGQRHKTIPAYASILFGHDGEKTAEIARRWRAAGYRAIKFGWEPMGQSEALDLELVAAARKGFGDDGMVLIDAGCVWDARTALQRALRFQDHNIGWLEEPLSQDDIDGYVWLRDRSPIPIAAGEGECGRAAFRPWIERHALDIYQVDLARNGFTDSLYIRQRVEEIGARLCNHCYKSPISVAACLHWLCTHEQAFLFEDCVEDSPLRHELTLEPMHAVNGMIAVPNGPGLGITLNEDFVQRHLLMESN